MAYTKNVLGISIFKSVRYCSLTNTTSMIKPIQLLLNTSEAGKFISQLLAFLNNYEKRPAVYNNSLGCRLTFSKTYGDINPIIYLSFII